MKLFTYERKGNTIRTVEFDRTETFKSINQAKKASHKIQMETDGGLGRGSLRRLA